MNLSTDSYLVKLGFVTDQAGFSRFQAVLRDASRVADNEVLGVAKKMFVWQTAIVSAFGAIAGAVLGTADKVAMADQEYRLFGLRMYMTTQQAKTLKIAMDALGQPLENIAWDPELRARFNQLVSDQQRLQASLGGEDFEATMKKIRDIRFEATRTEVELQYLAMRVVMDFAKALGLGPDQLLAKLRSINDWIITNLPMISQKIVGVLLPVMKDVRDVFTATVTAAKDGAVAFANLIGLLSGDSSLEGTSFSLEKVAKALQHVIHWMAVFAEVMAHTESMLAHFLSAISLALGGHFSQATSEMKAGLQLASAGTGAIIGAGSAAGVGTILGAALGVEGGPLGMFLGGGLGGMIGTGIGAMTGAGIGAGVQGIVRGTSSGPEGDAAALLAKYAAQMGVNPALALAVAMRESGMQQFKDGALNVNPKSGAMGLMQLMPQTARNLGLDASDTSQNAMGGVKVLRELLTRYNGNVPMALAAYNFGEKNLERVLAGRGTLPDETRAYVGGIMGSLGATGDVHIGSITIPITQPNATPDQIHRAVAAGVRDAVGKQSQRNIAEFASPAWSY